MTHISPTPTPLNSSQGLLREEVIIANANGNHTLVPDPPNKDRKEDGEPNLSPYESRRENRDNKANQGVEMEMDLA